MKHVSIDRNHTIMYEEFGAGDIVILLPSLFLSSYSYRHIAESLSRFYKIIIPNLHRNNSTYLSVAKTTADYGKELDVFIRKLNLHHFHVIGFSFSTILIMKYIADYPQSADRIILVSTTLSPEKIKYKLWTLIKGYTLLITHNLYSLQGIRLNLLWLRDGIQFLIHHPHQLFADISIALCESDFSRIEITKPIKIFHATKDEFLPSNLPVKKVENVEVENIHDYHAWFF